MRIGIAGGTGRMGNALINAVVEHPGCTLSAVSVRPGKDAASLQLPPGTLLTDQPEALFAASDAVIDFTAPAASLTHARLAAQHKKILVLGTTGFTDAEKQTLKAAAAHTPIVWSSNMSLGVNTLLALVEKATAVLGNDYEIAITETHHVHKKDSPSGTALMLGEAVATARGKTLAELRALHEAGKKGGIGITSKREGEVVGVHTVTFTGAGESVALTHEASSRDIYATGAVKAALWAKSKKPGLYSLKDVLGL